MLSGGAAVFRKNIAPTGFRQQLIISTRKEISLFAYEALLRHYSMSGQKTNPNRGNENGDAEQRHYRLKQAIEQSLILRGSRDFSSRGDYEHFPDQLFDRLNKGRKKRF